MFRLAGRKALVTGASRGLGKSIALVLARAGAEVALTARDERALSETAAEIRSLGGNGIALAADLSDPNAPAALVEQVVRELGGLEILVNNAGVGSSGRIDDITEDGWDETLDTNLKATFLLCKAAAPHLREAGWGRIVNIASIAAQTGGVAGSVAYSASKGGMLSLTKSLARDLAPHGVTVNAITPGQIETDMGRVPPDRLPGLLAQIPLGRLGVPDDIGYAALFLCSQEAGYITGATLDVNGGILKR
jgi:3-oxoacyl-[acyl-carrier protein] reductase